LSLRGKLREFLTPTFFRWALVGSFSLFLDIAIFALCYHLSSLVVVSNLIAAIASTSLNYSAHYFWTFQTRINHRQSLSRYILNIGFLWVVSTGLIQVFIEFEIMAINAKILSLLVVLPLNYISLSKFVYKNRA
jgi:putative flippase GtrA